MLSEFRRLFGAIKVVESNGVITCSGLPANEISAAITKEWETTVITRHLFITMTRSSFSFPSFFAVEVDYLLRQLLEKPKVRVRKTALRALLHALHEKTWLANISKEDYPNPFDYSRLKELKKDPLEHQRRFMGWYSWVKPRYGLNGTLLAAAAGGGKTITAMMLACIQRADTVVVISPNNAIYSVWEKSIRNELTTAQKVWVSQDDADPDHDNKWFVFNYEALNKAHEMVGKMKRGRVVVILDESHNLNSKESLRTERFLDLVKQLNPIDVLWLSGTPIKALGSEAIPLIRCMDPMFTQDVEKRFRAIYSRDNEKANRMLANRLGLIAYKIPKGDFMTDIPKPSEKHIKIKVKGGEKFTLEYLKGVMKEFINDRTIYYAKNKLRYQKIFDNVLKLADKELDRKARKELEVYKKYVDAISKGFSTQNPEMVEMAKYCNRFEKRYLLPLVSGQDKADFKEAKTVVKYVDLKIRGECLGRVLGQQRAAAIEAMVPYTDFKGIMGKAEKKTLIFTSYVNVVKAVVAKLEKQGYKPQAVYADTNKDLRSIISRMESDPNADPAVATFNSLSTAVPMTMIDNIIMMNQPFRIHEREQAISRAYRIGQDTQVKVWDLFLDTGEKANISTRSGDILEWSREQVNQIMGFDSSTEYDIGLEDAAPPPPERLIAVIVLDSFVEEDYYMPRFEDAYMHYLDHSHERYYDAV